MGEMHTAVNSAEPTVLPTCFFPENPTLVSEKDVSPLAIASFCRDNGPVAHCLSIGNSLNHALSLSMAVVLYLDEERLNEPPCP